MAKICCRARHHQVIGMRRVDRHKHLSDSTKINVGNRNAYKKCCKQEQQILDRTDPGYPSYSTHEYECRHEHECDDHCRSTMNRVETCDLDDIPQTLYLTVHTRIKC